MFPITKRFLKKKIGRILLEQGLITKKILNEALRFQKKFGGFLGNYLIRHGYVAEKDIVLCLSSQYGFPYIELSNYKIDQEVINLIPAPIAEKYCLMPIDKLGELVTIAIANPLSQEAINVVKLTTGCEVQVFISTYSEIKAALESHYGIGFLEETTMDDEVGTTNLKFYGGAERRRYVRLKANIDVHFAYQEKYIKMQTKDLSGGGVCFFSPNSIPENTYLTLEINLPKYIKSRPIASVIKVVRIRENKAKKQYELGAMFIQLDPLDRTTIMNYAKKFQTQDPKQS
ncbi:MAG: PilZ domain-containing protein [Candidatus Omnitrophota bacterium]